MYCFVAGRRKIDFPDTAIKHARSPEQTKENTSCKWIIKHSPIFHVWQGEIILHLTLLPLSQVKGQGTWRESRVKYQNPWAWRIITREQHPVPCWALGRDSPWDGEKEGQENSFCMETPSWPLRLVTENILQGLKFINIKENDEENTINCFCLIRLNNWIEWLILSLLFFIV